MALLWKMLAPSPSSSESVIVLSVNLLKWAGSVGILPTLHTTLTCSQRGVTAQLHSLPSTIDNSNRNALFTGRSTIGYLRGNGRLSPVGTN
jgi:hypothetical protein